MDEPTLSGYVQAAGILSRYITDTVVEEERITLDGLSEEDYEILHGISQSSYCFAASGISKSRFDPEKGWTGYNEYYVCLHKNFTKMWNAAIKEQDKERREKFQTFKTLSIDIETYSSNDIADCGVYKYAEADDFTILLFAYSLDYGETEIVDFASGETLPEHIYKASPTPRC